ncbi:hypothetical protein FB45DRAFT_1008786 [Roridomyces roridus]|uniref:Uncharacterized protein n=1 Tax=Roridomyces roridus TaxID=1738132 RepID=A0AAD7B9H1_9AGAR|nr:hypothetical protein FB45DRAFT_1008786 [Roridomyces roridus]
MDAKRDEWTDRLIQILSGAQHRGGLVGSEPGETVVPATYLAGCTTIGGRAGLEDIMRCAQRHREDAPRATGCTEREGSAERKARKMGERSKELLTAVVVFPNPVINKHHVHAGLGNAGVMSSRQRTYPIFHFPPPWPTPIPPPAFATAARCQQRVLWPGSRPVNTSALRPAPIRTCHSSGTFVRLSTSTSTPARLDTMKTRCRKARSRKKRKVVEDKKSRGKVIEADLSVVAEERDVSPPEVLLDTGRLLRLYPGYPGPTWSPFDGNSGPQLDYILLAAGIQMGFSLWKGKGRGRGRDNANVATEKDDDGVWMAWADENLRSFHAEFDAIEQSIVACARGASQDGHWSSDDEDFFVSDEEDGIIDAGPIAEQGNSADIGFACGAAGSETSDYASMPELQSMADSYDEDTDDDMPDLMSMSNSSDEEDGLDDEPMPNLQSVSASEDQEGPSAMNDFLSHTHI